MALPKNPRHRSGPSRASRASVRSKACGLNLSPRVAVHGVLRWEKVDRSERSVFFVKVWFLETISYHPSLFAWSWDVKIWCLFGMIQKGWHTGNPLKVPFGHFFAGVAPLNRLNLRSLWVFSFISEHQETRLPTLYIFPNGTSRRF